MRSSRRSDPLSANRELLRRILRVFLLVFLTVFLIMGSFITMMYFSYGSEAVLFVLSIVLEVLLPGSLIVPLLSVPVIFSLLRAYRRGFTPLTRSFIEVMGSILLSLALGSSLGLSVFLLIKGASIEIAIQAAVYSIRSFLEIILLPMIPAIVTLPLATKYIDRGERVPYPSILLITLTMFVLFRNLMAASLLQSDMLSVRMASLMMVSPIVITGVWMLISEKLTLKFTRAERVTDREFLEFIEELRKRAGVNAPIEVLSAQAVEGHARVLGIRRIVLLVSEDLIGTRQLQRKIAETVIMHELMHVRNLDTVSHTLATTAYRSMLATGLSLLTMFFILPELRQEIVLIRWLQLHVLNPFILFASERWCHRLREVHADLKVQEKGIDLMEVLKLISVPKKKRIRFLCSKSRTAFLREPYRAFIPSYPEGFAFSIALIHLSAISLYYVQSSLYYAQLPSLANPLNVLLFILMGMIGVYLILAVVQLHELGELASELGLKPKLRNVLTPQAVIGALAGFLVFTFVGFLPDILKAVLSLL